MSSQLCSVHLIIIIIIKTLFLLGSINAMASKIAQHSQITSKTKKNENKMRITGLRCTCTKTARIKS